MPRRSYKKRKIPADPLYKSIEVTKLINFIMQHGKKTVASRIVYNTFDMIKKENKDPLEVLQQAIRNVAPEHEVKPRRLGGASYLVPIEVRQERKLYLALNWIIDSAQGRSNAQYKSFENKLYAELVEAAKNEGNAVAKKAQVQKLAEANKAFAHLRW